MEAAPRSTPQPYRANVALPSARLRRAPPAPQPDRPAAWWCTVRIREPGGRRAVLEGTSSSLRTRRLADQLQRRAIGDRCCGQATDEGRHRPATRDPRERARARRRRGVGAVARSDRPGAVAARAEPERPRARRRPLGVRRPRRRSAGDPPHARRPHHPRLLGHRRLQRDLVDDPLDLRRHGRGQLLRAPVRLASRQPRRGTCAEEARRRIVARTSQGRPRREARPRRPLDGRARLPALPRMPRRMARHPCAHHVRHAPPGFDQRRRLPRERVRQEGRAR